MKFVSSSFDVSQHPRHTVGSSRGGQFAEKQHSEAAVTLGDEVAPGIGPDEAMVVAATAQRQITPGVLMSVGARSFYSGRDGALHFDVTSAGRKRHVVVALGVDDTYTVKLTQKRRGRFEFEHDTIEEHDGVYADGLARLILTFDRESDKS